MLILTEKPSVAKEFARALKVPWNKTKGIYENGHYTITNCIGHLFELEEPAHYGKTFPIIPDQFDYAISPKVGKQARLVIKTLKASKEKNDILIATDADREGEIIARECLNAAGVTDTRRIKRFWVSEALTDEVIKDGIENARSLSEYDKLSKQGFARQRADWLVGMNFCRYISQQAKTWLIVGRVQTAILSAIEMRCRQIENFKSEKYYEYIGGFVPKTSTDKSISCKGIYFQNEKTTFSTNSEERRLSSLIGKEAKLLESKNERKTTNPPELYNLNALQKDAYKHFGYTADETLKITQSLYEKHKCVSYPRTPSRVMGSGNVELCKKIADDLSDFYTKFSPHRRQMYIEAGNKRCVNDKKLESHHALIPLKEIPTDATAEEENVYTLILERFFLAFLPPEVYEKQTYILDIDGNTFRVTGRKTVDAGWKSAEFLDSLQTNKPKKSEELDEQEFTSINWNTLKLAKIEAKEKWTKAPPYFNEANILSFMENPKNEKDDEKKLTGLGTASTRHIFVPKLLKNEYIKKKEKNLIVTEKGKQLLTAVRSSKIKNLASISNTTEWEERLDDDPEKFLSDMKEFVKGVFD